MSVQTDVCMEQEYIHIHGIDTIAFSYFCYPRLVLEFHEKCIGYCKLLYLAWGKF